MTMNQTREGTPGIVDAWDQELATRGRVELSPSRGRLALLLVGTLIFAVVGMLMLLAPDGGWSLRILGGVTVGFFGVLGIPSLARQLLEAGSPVVIDAEGIHVPRGFDLPWHEIRSVGVFNVRGARTVSLGVGHAYLQRWLTGRSPFMRLLTGANRALVGEDAFSLPSTLKADADTVAHWIGEETARRQGRPDE